MEALPLDHVTFYVNRWLPGLHWGGGLAVTIHRAPFMLSNGSGSGCHHLEELGTEAIQVTQELGSLPLCLWFLT